MIARQFILLWYLSQVAYTIKTNITIDDSFPDPRTGNSIIYNPPDAWNSGTFCQRGPGNCTAVLDTNRLSGGTWHECTFNPVDSSSNDHPNTPSTATVQFNGTAIYVYCALALTTSSPSGNSDMSFFIDGKPVGNFVRPAPNALGYEYNFLVYSNEVLPPNVHELSIINGRAGGSKALIIIIDRIVYSREEDLTSSSLTKSSGSLSDQLVQPTQSQSGDGIVRDGRIPQGTVVGVVLGSVAGTLLVVAAIILGLHWRRKRPDPVIQAFRDESPPPYTSFLNPDPHLISARISLNLSPPGRGKQRL